MLEKLQKDIATKEFSKVYIFYGDENYLKNLYKNRLLSAIGITESDMNYNYYEGKNIDYDEIFRKFLLFPFLNDKRVIVIENSDLMQKESERLIKEIDSIPDFIILIFLENSIDKRKKSYTLLKKIANIVEFKSGDYKEAYKISKYLFNKNSKKVSNEAIRYIIDNSESNMYSVINNTEKVIAYSIDKEDISINDAKEVIFEKMENKIFDMIRAAIEKDDKVAIKRYKELMYYKEAPYKILYIITNEINNILKVKEMNGKVSDIAKLLNKQEFVIENYIKVSEKYTIKRLVDIIKKCGDLEYEIKSGIVQDRLGLEKLIMDIMYE